MTTGTVNTNPRINTDPDIPLDQREQMEKDRIAAIVNDPSLTTFEQKQQALRDSLLSLNPTTPDFYSHFDEKEQAWFLKYEQQLQEYRKLQADLQGQTGPITEEQLRNARTVPLLGAYVARRQWEDYKNRFIPIEDALMGQAYNPAVAQGEIDAGKQAASRAIDTSKKVAGQRVAALGGAINPAMQARVDKTYDTQRALSVVDAANRIRQNVAERSRNIAFTGGSSGRQGIAQAVNDQTAK